MKKQISFFILIILLSNTCHLLGQKNAAYADSLRRASKIPELTYAVVTGDSVLELAAMGRHSVDLPDTATLDDRFHIGSNTKAMTAFIIAKYVEKGKLKWDTKFFELFPDLKNNSNTAYHNITLEQLLSHRAGIHPFQDESDPPLPPFVGNRQQKRWAFGDFALVLDPMKPDSLHPFVYSNAGYTLATMMVEKVTRKSWEQLVEKVFNRDLKLDVKLSWPDNQTRKDTWGHTYENNQLTPMPSNSGYHLDYTEPAGDINVKLKNYLKFVQLQLQGLEGKDNYLKASTYRYIHKGIENYSIGWFNVYENGADFSTHSGTVGTYFSLVAIDRKKLVGYVIFANSFNEETVNGVRLLMRKLKQDYGQ